MALSGGKKTVQGSGRGLLNLGVAAAAVVYQGGLAMLSSGYALAARIGQGAFDSARVQDAGLSRVVGVAQRSVTGTAANGGAVLDAQAGDWLFKNSANFDALTVADIGRYCFVVDDETVARTSASRTRPRAGVVKAVDSTGVMVSVSPEIAAAADRTIFLPFFINVTDLGTPVNQELVSPVFGTVTRMLAIVQTAIVTGGDITAMINATPVAGLSCDIADGAAKGSVAVGTSTAGAASAVIAVGQRIQIVPAGAFAGGGSVSGILEIAY
jgi:hypothetical protein